MTNHKYSRSTSFIICTFVYLIAIAFSVLFVNYFKTSIKIFWLILVADLLATVLVFGFSIAFNNSSLYDPYWSVAPPLIAWYWLVNGNNDLAGYLILAVIILWSVRLTLNWCRGWQGLSHEDWRYRMLREKNPGLYPLINLTGIHLFPTIMVFLGMLPVFVITAVHADSISINYLFLIGLVITTAAIIIELVADEQLRRFKMHAKRDEYINRGLWKYSRHPNYFGEILFWFGLWVMQIAVATDFWWTAIGFIAMLCMFLFASIPMMETKNRNSKDGYENYVNRVSKFIPLPVKKNPSG